jgi:peptide/nickel transport system substrate-binding protein
VIKRLSVKALALAMILGMLLSGCTTGGNSGSGTGSSDGAPKSGGILRVATTADAVGFDPHLVSAYSSALVIEQAYNSLLKLDQDLKLVNDLAESYEVSGDGMVYTFKLHKGVKFHNGREMTAADVKYSLERVKDPTSPRAYTLEPVASIDVVDDYTVKLSLSKPFAPLLVNLAGGLMAIVPKETVEKHGDLQNVMDGTGPFKLKEYVPGQVISLEKNPDYFKKGLPYLDGIEFKAMADETARLTSVRTGEVDVILEVPQKDVSSLKSDSSVVIVGGPGSWYDYIGINNNREPFADVKVRQALAYGVDRKAIVDIALFGEATPIKTGPIPPSHWAYVNDEAYKRDIAKAKQLLAEAGFPNGFKATLKVGADYKSQVAIAQVVQSQLKDIGIEVEVKPMEWGLFIDEVVNKNDFDMTILGWIGATDPDAFMYAQFKTGEKWNFYKFSDQQVDDLVEQGRTAMDQNERKRIYTDAQKRVAELSPYVFLHINNQYEAYTHQVKGFVHYPTGSMQGFHKTWIDK